MNFVYSSKSSSLIIFNARLCHTHSVYGEYRFPLADFQDQFAAQMPCLADFLRFSGIFQIEQRDFRDRHDPCIIKFGNPFHVMPCASHAGPQRLDVVAGCFRRLGTGSNKRCPPTGFQHVECFQADIAADGIEHGVAIRHDLGEVNGVVIDDFVGTEPTDIFVVAGAGCRDDMRADMLGELDGEPGNTAGTALDQDFFTGLQLQRFFDGEYRR